MATPYEGISHVVHISTNVGRPCDECRELIDGEDFAEAVNHYLEEHGYRLLHVGTETIENSDGSPWHTTIAVVGKE